MTQATSHHETTVTARAVDAVIVGAGFAGLYMLHRLRAQGLSVVLVEAGGDVGGTWYWNRYPGARCDVQSIDYSYSFSEELQQEWVWSERYAPQAEILAYLRHVVDRFDLRRDIRLDTRVTAAIYDEAERRWSIATDAGDRYTARFCIIGTGCLSIPKPPEVAGIDRFAGDIYQTSMWPHDGMDFTGKRVAVIGTGSSGIQSIPVIAEQARELLVFQRTPAFTVPAHNGPLDAAELRAIKATYGERRRYLRSTPAGLPLPDARPSALAVSEEERTGRYQDLWTSGYGVTFGGAFGDLMIDSAANDTAAEFVRGKIRETVTDADTAEALSPRENPIGTKRICVDSHYYATFNRDNVTLVDLRRTPIEALIPAGIRTSDGDYAVDAIVFATGFDAMTGALGRIDIRGVGGLALRDKWAAGARSYLGLVSAGFPNLFTITGPQSPSVLTNMVMAIEQHVEWIADCIAWMDEHSLATIDADPAAEDAWVAHADEVTRYTLYPSANSWYMGANVPGKPRLFMPYIGGLNTYRDRCAAVAANDYEGFRFEQAGTGCDATTAAAAVVA